MEMARRMVGAKGQPQKGHSRCGTTSCSTARGGTTAFAKDVPQEGSLPQPASASTIVVPNPDTAVISGSSATGSATSSAGCCAGSGKPEVPSPQRRGGASANLAGAVSGDGGVSAEAGLAVSAGLAKPPATFPSGTVTFLAVSRTGRRLLLRAFSVLRFRITHFGLESVFHMLLAR